MVIRVLGMTRPRIYEWLAAYREGGYEALKAKQLFGRPPKLTGKQLRSTLQHYCDEEPAAVEVSLCAVDTVDGAGSYPG